MSSLQATTPAAVGIAVAALVTPGCGLQSAAPPKSTPEVTIPSVERVSKLVDDAAKVRLRVIARDSAARRARQITVRVRNIGCGDVLTGSGFALTPQILITNRHVLAGADILEVNTWDGRSLRVTAAQVGRLGDLGAALVEDPLPRAATFGPAAWRGALVTVVGYPMGGALNTTTGTVVDRVDGQPFDIPGPVMRVTALVVPGSSGGPVLDRRGRVVGVIFAEEIATGLGLAIPIDTLEMLVRDGGLQDLPGCGEP